MECIALKIAYDKFIDVYKLVKDDYKNNRGDNEYLKLLEKLGRKRVIMDRYENEPIQHVTILFLGFKIPMYFYIVHKGDLDDL